MEFTLTNEAGEKFYDYTKANVGNPMAVVMGNSVREVATIKGPIHDRGEIEGAFSEDEVTALSKLLRTGSLPASLTYLEQRTVGASLGADSVHEGVTAAVVGMLVVLAFMLVYYRGAGINADLALILNLVILLGFMGAVGATLTLPGIAGVILTIGMGVDSNVLIFERIREETAGGQSSLGGGGPRFCSCVGHHRGHARDHDCLGGDSVPVRHWSGKGICYHADVWSAGQPFHCGVCIADDL